MVGAIGLRRIGRLAPAALGLSLLAGCYSTSIDTVPPGSGTRITGLADGIYAKRNKDFELRWIAIDREYAVDEFVRGRWDKTYRMAAKYLGRRHWMLRIRIVRDSDGPVHEIKIANMLARIRGDDLVLLSPSDSKAARELAENHGVELDSKDEARITSGDAKAIYAFMHDLVASRSLEGAEIYRFVAYLDSRPRGRVRWRGWRDDDRRGWRRGSGWRREPPKPAPEKPAPGKPAPKKPAPAPKKPWECTANDILKAVPGCE